MTRATLPQCLSNGWMVKAGRRSLRKSIQLPGSDERLYLDNRANVPEISPKATQVQDVLAGIAAVIGGDHTHDVSRILRIPGTFNRKDQRNGRQPKACELVECVEDRTYPFVEFVKFAESSPQRAERQKIAAVGLPQPRPLTPTKRDKLNELVTACAAARVGTRSEADWRLICAAIEKGWPKLEVWQAVANVGKFAEAGEAYFERSWSKAESQTREQIFRGAAERATQSTGESDAKGSRKGDRRSNDEGGGNPGIVVTLAQLICEKERFAQDEGGKLYRYRGGVYRSKGESFVKGSVKRLCGKLNRLADWSSHVANEVVEYIRVDSPLLWERPPRHVVNVQNGLVELRTKRLMDHSPDHLSAVQLPVTYDPTASCPRIDRFISETFPEDAITIAYEIPAWLMLPDTSIQKAILLIGAGGNGKSRYLKMVEAFLGKVNVSNLSLHRLESDKFACAAVCLESWPTSARTCRQSISQEPPFSRRSPAETRLRVSTNSKTRSTSRRSPAWCFRRIVYLWRTTPRRGSSTGGSSYRSIGDSVVKATKSPPQLSMRC